MPPYPREEDRPATSLAEDFLTETALEAARVATADTICSTSHRALIMPMQSDHLTARNLLCQGQERPEVRRNHRGTEARDVEELREIE